MVKKKAKFHDNESENISRESIRGVLLILGQHLIKEGAYSSKDGMHVEC